MRACVLYFVHCLCFVCCAAWCGGAEELAGKTNEWLWGTKRPGVGYAWDGRQPDPFPHIPNPLDLFSPLSRHTPQSEDSKSTFSIFVGIGSILYEIGPPNYDFLAGQNVRFLLLAEVFGTLILYSASPMLTITSLGRFFIVFKI